MHEMFEGLFAKLVGRWKVYQDAPRHPERVPELAAARADLDDARNEIAEVRKRLEPHHRHTPPARPGIAIDPAAYTRVRISQLQDTA